MTTGVLLALGAYLFWGLTPLFWKLLAEVPAIEQLAHRIVWSLPLLALAAFITGGIRTLGGVDRRGWARFLAGGLLLSVNWGVFVWAVASDRVVEASLGYYINPLVSVALGVLVLGEHLRPTQWTAVALAFAGVLYLALRLGEVPWVSLALAFSFGVYGLLQKRHGSVGPWASLGAEIMWLWPIALGALVVWGTTDTGAFGSGAATTSWLLLTGPVTIVPLLLFGAAARRIPLSTIGLLQYLAPTMQLLLGVFAFGEPMPVERLVGFVFVWAAVALYVWDLRTGTPAGATAPA